jgi:SAM-dependent methyltransferase
MEPTALFEAFFWQEAWDEANRQDRERKQEEKAVDVWNRRAGSYDRNADSDSGNRRVREALAFLDAYGVLDKPRRILDLGCGPGHFSLAFAERGHQVVALDPARGMLEMLEQKLAERPEIASRITLTEADWVPLNLADYGWESHFDLVFASMTPGIRDTATLQKAMDASRHYIYLSRFAGPRTQPSVEEIWYTFRDKPYYSLGLDILLPQNWLYALGYRPALHFSRWHREHSQPAQAAVEEIKNVLALRMDVDETVERVIEDYVWQRCGEDGLFRESKGATSAMLLWDKGKNVLTRLGG